MASGKIICKEEKEINSPIVSSLVGSEVTSKIGAKESIGLKSKYYNIFNNRGKNKNVIIVSTLLIVVIIVFVVLFLFFKLNNKHKVKTDDTLSIYEKAYASLNFKENTDLTKLSCSKDILMNTNSQVKEEDSIIYYFDNEKVDTIIYHNYITISDDYMDYYNTMYNEYDKSLKADFHYDNVGTNVIKDGNSMLVTVIIYSSKEGANKLNVPNFTGYENAKKEALDGGYQCH